MNHVDNIDENYCFQIWKLYENEYIWTPETQMFEMTYIKICKIYIKALSEYKIDEFISIVDPCNRIRDTWPEKHVKFIKYIQRNIINEYASQHRFETDGYTVKQIKKFSDVFEKYTDFLSTHMIMSEVNKNYYVPFPEIRNNSKKWRKFERAVMGYRKTLIDINFSIAKHLRITEN